MTQQASHFLVEGKVQGVGFRNYVLKKALIKGLRGWVRNLTDGRVEVLVSGDKDSLDFLEHILWRGPEMAEVKQVTVKEVLLQTEPKNFYMEKTAGEAWSE